MAASERFAAPVGAIAAITVAGLLVPLRDWLGSTNVALVLVVVVAGAAAVGGRVAGATTSVAAAMAFNFFQTEPHYSLRIEDRHDIVTAVLLLVVGLIVGEVAALRRRSQRAETRAAEAVYALEEAAAAVAAGRDLDSVWPSVRSGLVRQLRLADARFEPGAIPAEPLPRIERDGTIRASQHVFTRDGFALPPDGAEILVGSPPSPAGRVVVVPLPGTGVTRRDRRAAVALVDQLAVVATRSRGPASPASPIG